MGSKVPEPCPEHLKGIRIVSPPPPPPKALYHGNATAENAKRAQDEYRELIARLDAERLEKAKLPIGAIEWL